MTSRASRVGEHSTAGFRGRCLRLGLVPLLLLVAGMKSLGPESGGHDAGQRRAFEPAQRFRTVVLILDSAGSSEVFDPSLMPFVSSLRGSSLWGGCRSCSSKATFPCIKSIFEGREATMGTTLQDFSAFASSRTTWPGSLAALGLRLVVASDHTLNRLYPHAFVDSLNYENLHVPLLERDAFVYRKAAQWLDDPAIDVLLLHIIGTDKVSHEYPVRGPEYTAKYQEVDNFIREVAARLQPQDYLYVMSDHGHNELGGHTREAAYLVHGPLFLQARRADLNAQDMLFLLSAPYGLTMPKGYEGQIRSDLTLLPAEARAKLFAEQARLWAVPVAGMSSDAAEIRLNEYLAHQRAAGQRQQALDTLWRVAPWWLAALLFLIRELPFKEGPFSNRRAFHLQVALVAFGLGLTLIGIVLGGWLVTVAALLRCVEKFGWSRSAAGLPFLVLLIVSGVWLLPSHLSWIHDRANRPLGFLFFYAVAILCGVAVSRLRGENNWRRQLAEVLWTVSAVVWLLAYFGPLGYSLTRHGSAVVLGIVVPVAVILSGGFRIFFSIPALFLFGLLPLLHFSVESFNVRYPLLDQVPELHFSLCVVLCVIAALLLVFAFSFSPDKPERRFELGANQLISFSLIAVWLVLGASFFLFDFGKLIGGLLAALWLAGCLALFQRAQLPPRWFALASAIFFFVLLTFFLNGFALSHVDFRFAAHTIIPFQKEAFRAPQLILWSLLKYTFALLPALAVLRAFSPGMNFWPHLLLLGWWRQSMIVLDALGLAIFNTQGMQDLCSEEIYFWTFLNLVFWAACLFAPSPSAKSEAFGSHAARLAVTGET